MSHWVYKNILFTYNIFEHSFTIILIFYILYLTTIFFSSLPLCLQFQFGNCFSHYWFLRSLFPNFSISLTMWICYLQYSSECVHLLPPVLVLLWLCKYDNTLLHHNTQLRLLYELLLKTNKQNGLIFYFFKTKLTNHINHETPTITKLDTDGIFPFFSLIYIFIYFKILIVFYFNILLKKLNSNVALPWT